jgi:hypothetical protein
MDGRFGLTRFKLKRRRRSQNGAKMKNGLKTTGCEDQGTVLML